MEGGVRVAFAISGKKIVTNTYWEDKKNILWVPMVKLNLMVRMLIGADPGASRGDDHPLEPGTFLHIDLIFAPLKKKRKKRSALLSFVSFERSLHKILITWK